MHIDLTPDNHLLAPYMEEGVLLVLERYLYFPLKELYLDRWYPPKVSRHWAEEMIFVEAAFDFEREGALMTHLRFSVFDERVMKADHVLEKGFLKYFKAVANVIR